MRLKRQNIITAIRHKHEKLRDLSDTQLREASLALRYEILAGRKIKQAIVQAFPLVMESIERSLDLRPHDVQLLGGIEMACGRIVEMKTGEGKTLTATLPTFLFGLAGKGVHIATVNDYLAKRDATTMRPVFERLGLTVSYIQSSHPPEKRREAYRSDVVYSTAKELGFDFLKSRLNRIGLKSVRQGGNHAPDPQRYCILVDEADSILIDEARTPLIIGAVNEAEEKLSRACYEWAAEHSSDFEEDIDYRYDHKRHSISLLSNGMKRLRQLPGNDLTNSTSLLRLNKHIENAIKVNRNFTRDKNYAVIDEEVVIIDEFTGRPAEGRKWQQGIHQAVEAREGVAISPETKQAASITIQTLVRLYENICGMTGTAWTSRREFKKVYKRKIVRIPTNKPVDRSQFPVRIFANQTLKFSAVVEEIQSMVAAERPVLIGTRSVDKSETLSQMLDEVEIAHQVLNAKLIEQESEIIALAGQRGRVTVATNMAGRGTDIKLADRVREVGGLHVILTEIHEAERIDWQLIGRSSRQGDPGSYRIFLAMDDEILRLGLGPTTSKKLQMRFAKSTEVHRSMLGYFRRAQTKLERRHLTDRMILMRQDKERRERLINLGKDPFVSVVES